jgi:hypothetical protein
MMQVDDSFPNRLTCGAEGSRMTTRDVEEEAWTTALPQPTITLAMVQTVD